MPQRPKAAIKTACAFALMLSGGLLAGCTGGVAEPEVSTPQPVAGFAGVLAADEPRAAVVGREILANNANAADAAVAMALTMTVTLPSHVGLGGGGACVIHKREPSRQDALIFLPENGPPENDPGANDPGANGDGPRAVPSLARGLAALHARYGLNRWSELVQPAERLAAFGHEVSRAFRRDLIAARDTLGPVAEDTYMRADGTLPEVGDRITQPALGTALAGLRQQGASYALTGSFARNLTDGAQAAGVPLTLEDLRAQKPRFVEPLALAYGPHRLYLPPAPVHAGARAARAWQARRDAGGRGGSPATLARMLGAWGSGGPLGLGENTAGLAVADRFGNVVACGFTLNGRFGDGRMAGGTGVLLPAPPPPEGAGVNVLPAVVANPNTATGYLGGHGGPDDAGQAALLQTLARLEDSFRNDDTSTLLETNQGPIYERVNAAGDSGAKEFLESDGTAPLQGLDRLLASARVAPGPEGLRYESGAEIALREALGEAMDQNGMSARESADPLGRVLLVHCPRGANNAPGTCAAAADPRGHGMAVHAQ